MALPMAGDTRSTPGATEGFLTPELRQQLDDLVQGNDLVLFMKGTPEQPQCGFSARAAQVYQSLGHPFQAVDVFSQGGEPMGFVRALAEWADWPTLPQCWVKGELIGGSDIALEMAESGELQKMLGIEASPATNDASSN